MSNKIFRGNLQAVRKQIADALALKLDAADQFGTIEVTGATSPALADVPHESTFYNSTGATQTVTLPNSGLGDHVGKRFHFVASGTYGSPLTVTSGTVGLLRDKANGSAPHTVTNGTLTVTVAAGASSAHYYSVGGDFA